MPNVEDVGLAASGPAFDLCRQFVHVLSICTETTIILESNILSDFVIGINSPVWLENGHIGQLA